MRQNVDDCMKLPRGMVSDKNGSPTSLLSEMSLSRLLRSGLWAFACVSTSLPFQSFCVSKDSFS